MTAETRRATEAAIKRLMGAYGQPRQDEWRAFLGEVARVLERYHPETMRLAVERLIDTQKFWPAVAEVKQACDVVATLRAPRSKPQFAEEPPQRSPEEVERVRALVRQTMAVLAGPVTELPPPPEWRRGMRPEFEQMQRRSRTGLHLDAGAILRGTRK